MNHKTPPTDQGFAAIDALVGLTILGSVLSFAMVAAVTGEKIEARAKELRAANVRIAVLIETAPRSPGEKSGSDGAESWSIKTLKPEANAPKDLCPVEVELLMGPRHTRYIMKTLRQCDVDLG